MRLARWTPMLLLLVLAGCGAERKIAGPMSEANGPRATALAMSADAAAHGVGAVYVATNAPAGNAVLAFARGADGQLGEGTAYATGGTGTGAGLGNQGGLVLGQGGRWLFVVNAGSSEISSFRVAAQGLELADRVASGGERPVSLAVSGELLYVLNAGGSGNIQGFRIGAGGGLSAIAGSSRPLSNGAAMAAQIAFTPDGTTLVVTERATNLLTTYAVGADGIAGPPVTHPSSGMTPFGFNFDARGELIVSEAFGGAANASAVSSYQVAGGAVNVVSASVPTTQTAACWIAVTGNGRYAYTTNAASGTITGYAIGQGGALMRLDANGVTATTGMGPNEMALSSGSRYLFDLNTGAHTIGAFTVGPDGGLSAIGAVAEIPAGANGIAAK